MKDESTNVRGYANRESGVIQTSNRARLWQIWEAKGHLKSFSRSKASQSLRSIQFQPTAERAISILAPKNVDFKLTHDTVDRLSRVHTTQTTLLESDIGRVSVWKNPGLSSEFSNSIES